MRPDAYLLTYFTDNSKYHCKWCNMGKPAKNDVKTNPVTDWKQSDEIDLFDIPIYAAMTQDQGSLDKQRLSDFIGKYFNN